MSDRSAIPAALERDLMIEGGMMFSDDNLKLTLTRKGKRFIKNLSDPIVAATD
jgi:predicted transcriptional regulator